MIDVWAFSLSATERDIDRLSLYCSAEERARAEAFRIRLHGLRYIACRGRVREILAGYTGIAPGALCFTTSGNGKPRLAGLPAALYFNLSHSDDIGVVAVSNKHDVGVDIEMPRHVERDIANDYFSADEITDLALLPADEWLDGFFRCWTRKEAFIKATGDGLQRPLDSFSVNLEDGEGPYAIKDGRIWATGAPVLHLWPFRLPGGWIGAVCSNVESAPQGLSWRAVP